MALNELLGRIGLTEGESQVYLALVELGQCATGKIVDKAGIASSKVYEVLQRLTRKGLVSFVVQNGVRYYDATPPERLVDLIEDRKDALSQTQAEIRKALPVLKAKRPQSERTNQTVVYSGREGPLIALREALDEGLKGALLLGFGSDADPYLVHYRFELEKHFRAQLKHHVKWKMIFTQGFRSPNPLADVRYLPKGFT